MVTLTKKAKKVRYFACFLLVYIEMGSGNTATTGFGFTFDTSTTAPVNRKWEIKVTQIKSDSLNRPPSGCLQWHTGLIGKLTTFNFIPTNDNHLPNQE